MDSGRSTLIHREWEVLRLRRPQALLVREENEKAAPTAVKRRVRRLGACLKVLVTLKGTAALTGPLARTELPTQVRAECPDAAAVIIHKKNRVISKRNFFSSSKFFR